MVSGSTTDAIAGISFSNNQFLALAAYDVTFPNYYYFVSSGQVYSTHNLILGLPLGTTSTGTTVMIQGEVDCLGAISINHGSTLAFTGSGFINVYGI